MYVYLDGTRTRELWLSNVPFWDSLSFVFLSYFSWQLAAALRAGDELELRVEVLQTSHSRSGSVGIVKWRWVLTTQANVPVLDLVAISLFQIKESPGA